MLGSSLFELNISINIGYTDQTSKRLGANALGSSRLGLHFVFHPPFFRYT